MSGLGGDRPGGPAAGPPPVPGGRSAREREEERRRREARRAGPARLSGTDGAGPRRPGAPSPPRSGRRRIRPLQRLLGLAGVVLLIVAGWLLLSYWQPFAGEGEGRVRVRIPPGSGVGTIADRLADRGVVSSAFFFQLRARLGGLDDDLKPGTYTLRRDMSHGAALDALSAGPPRDVVNVTVPEGRSRREIAPIVRQAGLEGSYTRATRRSPALDPADYGAEGARDLEGFLYPSTFELKRGASAEDLVGRQLEAFKKAFRGVDLSAARRRKLSAYEVLTVASMVEREAQIDRERPLIASVIYNRLRSGEPLGIDATIRFATGNWTKPLTQSQLATPSPYNTRTNQGLPPGPIGNPGMESIRAAAEPADSDFLFYVVKPGTCGEHAFSRTLEDFNRDSERYNAERAARGGRSPTDCPE